MRATARRTTRIILFLLLAILIPTSHLVCSEPDTTDAADDPGSTAGCIDAVFARLDSLGVERATDKGTVKVREKAEPLLMTAFPDWAFYDISRELPMDGGVSYGYMRYDLAACRRDSATVLMLSDLSMADVLENELRIVRQSGVTISTDDDIQGLAAALDALYYDGREVEDIERLDETTWAIYTGTFFGKKKGFLVTANEDGAVTKLEYRLKFGEE